MSSPESVVHTAKGHRGGGCAFRNGNGQAEGFRTVSNGSSDRRGGWRGG